MQNIYSTHLKVPLQFAIAVLCFVCCFLSIATYAQTNGIKITGTIKDTHNMPLPGVNVKLKDGSAGASTDIDGKYHITVPNQNATLVFTYVGYLTQEIAVGNKITLDVTLAERSSDLNEVLVIAYGTSKKKDLTGSLAQVAMPDLEKAPVMSIDQALAGRMAGVQVSSADGQPGAAVNIVVRGTNSITQDNTPLYVVDGFPVEGFNLNTFNPQDIENIEVLKDASATALYGARAANGVIIITTKKGKVGAPQTTFTTTQSFSKDTKTMQLMTAYQFLQYQLERDPTAGSAAVASPTYTYLTSQNKTLADYVNYPSSDWQSPFFKTGSLRDYSLAIRGGTKETLYSVSGSADNQDGTVLATGYSRYQGRITLDQTLNDKLKIGVNANYAYMLQTGNSLATSTNSGTTNVLYSVWGSSPLASTSANNEIDATTAASNDYKFNPILNQENLVRNIKTNNLNVNAYLTYNIIPDLILKVTGVLNNTTTTNENFNNSLTYYGSPLTNAGQASGVNGSVATSKVNNWANENTLTYNHVFNQVHTLNVLAGFTAQGNTSSTYGFGANFLPDETLGISGLDEGTLNPSATKAISSLWNLASFLGRVSYNYNSVYYVTASYRADGSSKFSPANHWSYFPSGALAWRFTQTDFLKNVQWLSDGKLRASYGKTGNNRIPEFSYLSTSTISPANSYSFNNTYVASNVPVTIGNSDLLWETTDQYDAGIDISFLNSRINFTGDVYRKTTSHLLLNATLPTSTGYTSAFENVGSVQNQGLELTLNTVNIVSKSFKWTSNFNISFNQNKVLALAQNQQSMTVSLPWDNGWTSIPGYIEKIGQPLGLMYGYLSDGVYQYSDFTKTSTGTYVLKDNVPTNGNTRTSIQPGDIKYKDLNGDGVVNSSDYTVIGRSQPIHTGGFSNNFTYKNFDLNIFFQWSYGNDILDANQLVFNGNALGKVYLEQFESYADRWSPTNQGSANFRTGGYFGGGYASNIVQDGSYLRLKTASLGYNVPQSVLKKFKIASLRVYASGQNLWTWTNYTGLDPEVSAYNSVLTGGFDYSTYPRARTIAFGVNLAF
jgi:TonB-linked SusC/RagA family outer membrane protein